MNLSYIKTFLTVCECGNFTEAAKQLYIPQPTVSNRIRSLEKDLNQDLFVKKHKGKRIVKLTIAGEKFLPYAKQIIETLDVVKEELNSSMPKNRIRIGSTIPLTHPLLYEKIHSLYTSDENISLQVSCIESSSVISYLTNDEIDLALVIRPVHHKDLYCYPIETEAYKLILSAQHRLAKLDCLTTMESLKDENILLLDSYPVPLMVSNFIKRYCKKQLITDQIDLIKQFLENNLGITILPSVICQKEIEKKEFVSIPFAKKIALDKVQYYLVGSASHIEYKDMFSNGVQEVAL